MSDHRSHKAKGVIKWRISPRQLSPEQEQLVVDMYVKQGLPAWDVARALGPPGMWGQSDIYFIAKRIQKRDGLPAWDRHKDRVQIDWDLVHALRLEGTSWADMAEFIGCSDNLKGMYHWHKKRGRFDA